jgi:hypothetical protein
VGPIVDSRHGFGDAGALAGVLADGGFREVSVETMARDVQFTDGVLFARLNAMAVLGMTDKGKAMSEAERSELADQIAEESQHVIANATTGGLFTVLLSANIAIALA